MTTAANKPASAPAAAKKTAAAPRTPASGPAPAPAPASQNGLEKHLHTLAEGEVLDPVGMYEFMEALRALTTGVAFFVHAAGTQLESAARKGARDNTDGRLTMRQKAELALLLRRIGRKLDRDCAENLLATATGAVKAYALMQDFLENLESDNVARPHRSNRGGFSLGGK